MACRTAVEQTLLVTMARLETQSAFFGLPPLISSGLSFTIDCSGGVYFRTVREARIALDKLLASSVRLFVAVYQFPVKDRVAHLHPELAAKQHGLVAQLREFGQQLDASITHFLRSTESKEQRGLDLILLHHISFSILVETLFCGQDQSNYMTHIASFQRMMILSRNISQSFKGDSATGTRPTLLLDMGIIPSLFIICWKCRDSALRYQALYALEDWPHREGLWDSRLLAIFSRQIIELEKDALAESGDPNASSQILDHSLQVSDDQSHAILKYTTQQPGKEAFEQRRVITLDNEK